MLPSAAVTLFIFAVTSGSIQGWATAYVLTPLILSVLLLIAFFIWEARIEDIDAAMYVPYSSFHLSTVLTVCLCSPPSLWRHPNMPLLVAAALLPYFWWITSFILDMAWFEIWFRWSALDAAVHL